MMDIRERIDALTEAEAKAALYLAVKALRGEKMSEDAMMRKYAEAHGCWELRLTNLTDEQLKKWKAMIEREPSHVHIERDSPVLPLPCVRDEHGEIRAQPVYRLRDKVDEELGEVEAEILNYMPFATTAAYAFTQYKKDARRDKQMRVAEEIADTITALTTLAEALGIDAEMRGEAQRRVNEKNRERGRL